MTAIDQQLRADFDRFRDDFQAIRSEIAKVIVGQQAVVDGALLGLVAGGHILLEGVPGLGKTLLVRTVASVLNAAFSRIQFTPDLMPADLTGTTVMIEEDGGRSRSFRFQRGPLFANIVLADEINRARPRRKRRCWRPCRSSSVTVAGDTHALDEPFFVLATQNPLEQEGTYPLPEAQLDRFLFKLLVPFPSTDDIETILDRTTELNTPETHRVFETGHILQMSQLARRIPVSDEVRRYAIHVVMATHPEHELASPMAKQFVRFGSSPRGAQAIMLAAKINAILDARYHVARADIRAVAKNCLRHRVLLNFEGQAEDIKTDAILDDVLTHVEGLQPV